MKKFITLITAKYDIQLHVYCLLWKKNSTALRKKEVSF